MGFNYKSNIKVDLVLREFLIYGYNYFADLALLVEHKTLWVQLPQSAVKGIIVK